MNDARPFPCLLCKQRFASADLRNLHLEHSHGKRVGAQSPAELAAYRARLPVRSLRPGGDFAVLGLGAVDDYAQSFPAYPRLNPDGSVQLLGDERLLGSWVARGVSISIEKVSRSGGARQGLGGSKSVPVHVSLTDRRLLVQVPEWRKGLGVAFRVMTAMDDDAKQAVMAGHIPLMSVSDVEHSTKGDLSIYHLYGEGSDRYFFGMQLLMSVTDAAVLGPWTVAAVRNRWDAEPLPGEFRAAINAVAASMAEQRTDLQNHQSSVSLPFYRVATRGDVMVRSSELTPGAERLGTAPLL